MRLWMNHVIAYQPAKADFEEWVAKISQNLLKDIEKAAESGDMPKLSALAMEMKVYKKIGSMFSAERREAQAAQDYNNQTKE